MKFKNIDEFDVYELIDKVNRFCQEHQNVSDVQFVCNDGLYTAFLKLSEVENAKHR